MFNEEKHLKALPGMEDALRQVQSFAEAKGKKSKKDEKPKRWWDDDGDGVGYEKGEVSGSFKKEDVEQIDEISSHLALTASQKADEERRKAAVAGDKERAAAKAAQASRLYKGVGPRKTRERMKEEFEEDIFELIAEELGEVIDEMTDEELELVIHEALDVLEDDEEFFEAVEYFDGLEVLEESVLAARKETQRRRDQAKDRLATGAAMKSAAEKSSAPAGPSRVDRVKAAAKSAASKVKSGVKSVAKKVTTAAGKAAGTYQGEKEAARIKAKRTSMQNTPAKTKEKDSDDDGTGGKLDKLLASTRGEKKSSSGSTSASSGSTSSKSSSSSGGGSTTVTVRHGGGSGSSGGSSDSGSTRREVGSAIKKVGGAIVKGARKVVGKTARLVSKGADKVAKKLGEDVTCPVCNEDPCQCLEGTLEEGKNKEGKEQGVDGKACWKGYRYAGTENGKDKCVPASEELEAMEANLLESGLFSIDEVRFIIGEKFEELDEATAMAKRGHDETAIRNKIASNTGGGKSADRATALEKKPTYGDANKEKQRARYARAQRGDFRKTTSSSPGLHGYGHKATNAADKAKQAARGAQRGALTPNEKKDLGR